MMVISLSLLPPQLLFFMLMLIKFWKCCYDTVKLSLLDFETYNWF